MLFGRRDTNVHPAIILIAAITAPIAAILIQLAIAGAGSTRPTTSAPS